MSPNLFMDSLHPLQLHHPLVAVSKLVVKLLRGSLHQDGHRVGKQGPHRHGDQDSDEDGADGIGNHPVEQVHQDGGNDDAHAAKGVGQYVQENLLEMEIST